MVFWDVPSEQDLEAARGASNGGTSHRQALPPGATERIQTLMVNLFHTEARGAGAPRA